MYYKKLHISQIFSNLECSIFKLYDLVMCNLYTKFINFLEICKKFSEDLVTESGNVRRPGPVPRFSDLEVIALSMAAEAEEIDSENWLFEAKLQECRSSIPNLISRRQFNDRRKSVSGLCEQIRSRIANRIDGGEDYFCIDSKPIEVCRVARGKRCKMGRTGDFNKAPDFGYCASQGSYFFGYKLHALCGLSGVIHSYDLSKASVHDIKYLNDIKPLTTIVAYLETKDISERKFSLISSRRQTSGLSVPTGLIKRTGSRPSFLLQRQGKELKRSSHN